MGRLDVHHLFVAHRGPDFKVIVEEDYPDEDAEENDLHEEEGEKEAFLKCWMRRERCVPPTAMS